MSYALVRRHRDPIHPVAAHFYKIVVGVTAPTQRDRHLQRIADKGRMGWQRAAGYNRRARIEATMGRFKGVIGDGLRSRTDQRRATEVEVAVHALNRMLELGRPESVRIA